MTLQFGDPDDMNTWLAKIREAANRVRLADSNPLSAYNSHLAARVVEAERDYVPPHYAIYKVVHRPLSKNGSRSSSDDLSKMLATVCFLAIGVHKVHLIPLFKPPNQRASSPSLLSNNAQSSHGILSLTELRVSDVDDTFELTFRYAPDYLIWFDLTLLQPAPSATESTAPGLARFTRHCCTAALRRRKFKA